MTENNKKIFDGQAFWRSIGDRINFGTPEGDAALNSPALAAFIPGTGREAYLAWVQDWKIEAGFSNGAWRKPIGLYAHNLYALRRHSRRLAAIDYARVRLAKSDCKAA